YGGHGRGRGGARHRTALHALVHSRRRQGRLVAARVQAAAVSDLRTLGTRRYRTDRARCLNRTYLLLLTLVGLTVSTHNQNVPYFRNMRMSPTAQWLGGCG